MEIAKAVFTADQLESMLSRVLTTVIKKVDACMEKMLEKFESQLDRMYGDLAAAQCRIDKLEQLLEKAQVTTPVVESTSTVWPSIIRPSGGATTSTVVKPPASVPVTTRVGKRAASASVKASFVMLCWAPGS